MKTSVAMKVNQENLVKSLKFSFTNRSTVLGELMQNARRAGASQVSFNYDQATGTLAVADDGCGIDDIEALLTVAQSGWDGEVMTEEHPFGIGFLSALYACEHLSLVSKCGRLAALTADVLSFQDLEVDTSVNWLGKTIITLTGFGLDADKIDKELKTLAEGFPIPVFYNGESLRRYAAFDVVLERSISGLEFVETEIGWIHLHGIKGLSEIPCDDGYFKVYLQGLPIYENTSWSRGVEKVHIIHLDSARFYARLPDRDKLIDEREVVTLIQAVLNHFARQRLVALKASMAAEAFVEIFETLKFWKCLDLLNDVGFLPKQVVEIIDSYPVCSTEVYAPFTVHPEKPVPRSAIVGRKVEVVEIDDDIQYDGSARYMFAWLRDSLIYRGNLDEGHWIHSMVRCLSAEEVTVELVDETHSAGFNGSWVWVNVDFCEAYRIKVGGDVVEIFDHAYYQGSDHGETVVMPRGDRSSSVIEQVATFKSEYDDYQQATHDSDCNAFFSFVVANTTTDPAEAMGQLLPEFTGCPSLFGKAFVVSLDDIGKVASVLAA
jgi:hypothetical protein